MTSLAQTLFNLNCPQCGQQLTFAPNDAARALICPHCQCRLMLDAAGFLGGLNQADTLIADILAHLQS